MWVPHRSRFSNGGNSGFQIKAICIGREISISNAILAAVARQNSIRAVFRLNPKLETLFLTPLMALVQQVGSVSR
jgi:hypothetical protein